MTTVNYLAAGSSGGGNPLFTIGLMVVLAAVFYFLILRPQQKRKKAQAEQNKNLGAGSQIVTIGGLHGTVVGNVDSDVLLEVADGIVLRFAPQAIGKVLQKVDEDDPQFDSDDSIDDDDSAKPSLTKSSAASEPVSPAPTSSNPVSPSSPSTLSSDSDDSEKETPGIKYLGGSRRGSTK